MTEELSVADAKRRFSEVLSRVQLKGERFIIERRGTPVAALVPVGDFSPERKGFLALRGLWPDDFDADGFVRDIYRARRRAKDRPAPNLDE